MAMYRDIRVRRGGVAVMDWQLRCRTTAALPRLLPCDARVLTLGVLR
ncbi:MAG TPA: hypothetical protein VE944_09860 [Nostoc sp.]|nr:hypothetical protein [Nostoc sp.]HYX14655.1 hypothetical protein [Nostoc sp.]